MRKAVTKRSRVVFILLASLLIVLTYWFVGNEVEPVTSSAIATSSADQMRRKQRKHEDHKKEAIGKKSSAKVQSVEKVSIQDVHPAADMKMEPSANTLWQLQAKRNATLHRACGGIRMPLVKLTADEQLTLFKHMIVDDAHKIIYCYVPKAACANWKKVIQVMQGRYPSFKSINKTDHFALDFMYKYSKQEIMYRLRHYFKFTFVRHPLSRLVSAFRNKLHENIVEYHRKYGIPIIKRYRKNYDQDTKGDDVKFEEFVHYLIDLPTKRMNEHWRPYAELCQPCHVTYNFIGLYESLEDDANAVLEHVGAKLRWPQRQHFYKPTTTEEIVKLYKEVPPDLIQKLVAKYKKDLDMFGYASSEYL